MAASWKVNIGGVEYDAVEVGFEIRKEDWAEYEVADGGRVRLKTTVSRIAKVVDAGGNPVPDPQGRLTYFVEHNTQVVSSG